MVDKVFWLRAIEKKLGFKSDVLWPFVLLLAAHHVIGAIWCYYYAFPVKWQTVAFAVFMYVHSGLGLTTGAHRYWAHRSFKANLPMQILLAWLWSSAGMYKIRYWVLQHRSHHKAAETAADPHDITRGHFFAHVGWMLLKPVPDVDRCQRLVDMSDIDRDIVVRFTDRYYLVLQVVLCFALPTAVGAWLCGEWRAAVAWQVYIRYLATFHVQMTINSLAHSFGGQTYDIEILARDNLYLNVLTGGEGSHNYHHTFPFDHKGSHYPVRSVTTAFIRSLAAIGWTYDLREASGNMVKSHRRKLNQYGK